MLSSCGDDGGAQPEVEPYTPPADFRVPDERDLVRFVDPLIGSLGPGNVIPGALVPHGMVRASPDTNSPAGGIDAYEYADERIEGFTHMHLEGPGGSSNGYNQIRLMPVVGEMDFADYSSAYDHARETAEPGYYTVTLDDAGVRAELTATQLAAVHRYTFPAGDAKILIDIGCSNGRSRDGQVTVVDAHTIRALAQYTVHPGIAAMLNNEPLPTADTDLYVDVTFDRPMTSHGTWRQADPPIVSPGSAADTGPGLGVWAGFETGDGDVIEVRVGLSMISGDQAARNRAEQLAGQSFDEVRAKARDRWNAKLNRIQIDADDDVSTRFYTALYHAMFQPANYTEVGGEFVVASSGERHVLNGGGRPFYSDDWCMWDTFRTSHPLGTLLEPEIRANVVRSMLTIYQEGGWLPKCTWNATGYSRVMIGNHAIPIIADAAAKGLGDFDYGVAWQAAVKASTEEIPTLPDALCGYLGLGTPPEYLELGYVGHECDPTQAASMTLEHAYNDACMAALAEVGGLTAQSETYAARAQNFRNQFDAETRFMRPRLRDGSWLEPFDPADESELNGMCEATSWIYTFFVPHDVPALVELVGGAEAFIQRLDRFFDEGHFDPSNQPSFHIAWLYNYVGAAHKTQARVRQILDAHFSADPGGLPGNDDAGAMSAWFVWAALGLYPVSPGTPLYQLSTPLVDRAVIHLHPEHYDGRAFVIEAVGNSPEAVYIQSATLNGEPFERTWIRHDEIAAGGTLRLILGWRPSSWGSQP